MVGCNYSCWNSFKESALSMLPYLKKEKITISSLLSANREDLVLAVDC